VSAGFRKSNRDGLPQTGRSAGDQRDTVIEFECVKDAHNGTHASGASQV
jgi:hypothetical protein